MSAVTHSGPWTSNGKPRYIPCRCPAPTVAAATLCQSPCSPFSPKGYIARYGKKLIINNEKQTYRQSKMITDATYSNAPFPKNTANRFNGRGQTCWWLTPTGRGLFHACRSYGHLAVTFREGKHKNGVTPFLCPQSINSKNHI